MSALGQVLLWTSVALAVGATARWGWRLTFCDVVSLVLLTAGDIMLHAWAWAAFAAGLAVMAAWLWWRGGRGKRRRAARELGAKSRALVAGLVARAREGARPRRRPIPVPGGAA